MSLSPRRPRLLVIGPVHPFRGGIAHHTTLLYRALRQRFETQLESFRRQYIQWMYPGPTDKDISNSPIGVGDAARRELDILLPTTFFRAGRRAAQFDAVILPWWTAVWAPYYLLLLRGLRRRAKVVFICHNVVEHESSFARRTLTSAVLRRGDAFLVQNESERATLAQIVGDDRPIAVSPHPSYEIFDQGHYDRASARKRFGLAPDAEVLLFFGFIRPYKGLEYLLEAFARLAVSRPHAQLMVVGECWDRADHYRERARALDIDHRCTFVFEYVPNEDVEAYVKASDLVVLPYISGTGSGIAQIALAMDVPVVATRIPAFEGVIIDGTTGMLVPPSDSNSLAKAMDEALSSERQSQMREAIADDKHRFGWDVLADRIAELIESC